MGLSVAALTAACGNGSNGGHAAQTAPTLSASPTASAATIAQYASIVAKYDAAFRNGARGVENCYLLGDAATLHSDTCQNWMASTVLSAFTLSEELASAPRRIGPPPSEIATMVDTTESAAKAAATPGSIRGSLARPTFRRAAINDRSLESELDAWKPYGG